MLTNQIIDNLTLKFDLFKEFLIEKDGKFISFEQPYLDKYESYKRIVNAVGKRNLNVLKWSNDLIGTGEILKFVESAINVSGNNLLVHDDRNGKDGRDDKSLYKQYNNQTLYDYEKVLCDFYNSNVSDEVSFNRIVKIAGKRYSFIAYLFFLKSREKYLPIAPETFDLVFKSIGIDLKTSRKCSWDNYTKYLDVIHDVRNFLQVQNEFLSFEVNLLDTHTFLWVLGSHMKNWYSKKETIILEQKIPFERIELIKRNINSVSETIYEPNESTDFIGNNIRKHKLGMLAEQKAFEYEKTINKNVEIVSNNFQLGYDIEVRDDSGSIIKRIEVKTESTNRTFFLTRNELEKSKKFSNYYIYVVKDPGSNNSSIKCLKSVDIENELTCLPLIYKVFF